MKKILSMTIAILIIASLGTVTAFAEEPVGVTIEYGVDAAMPTTTVTDNGNGFVITGGIAPMAASKDYDLGDSGSLSMSISTFTAGQVRQSDYNYKTNSTKIKITMKSDKDLSVRVKLYDASNDSEVAQTTMNVGNVFNTSATFSNLTSSKKYYIKYENLGQQTVNITGTISAK